MSRNMFSLPALSKIFIVSLVSASVCVTSAATTVTVSASTSHPIPSTLWGQMFEDINNSGDGGLYAELLQNRAFQKVTPNTTTALAAWAPVNGGKITVIADPSPVSSALPNSLQLTVPAGRSGSVGFGNEGFEGIKVDSSWTYKASFFYKFPSSSKFRGKATVALQSSTGEVFGSSTVSLSGAQTTWTQVHANIKPKTSAPSTANNFTITLDGRSAAGQTIHFAMLSLFPPTFKNRPNGMRIDIAETLAEMRPSFFRLPGGNNLGQTTDTRWQWNATVGPLVDRPGRIGDWGYANTDGLGLLEYLEWTEDLNMQPIMAIWAGYSLGGTSLPEDQLGPFIQQARDQINFVVGDPSKSKPAALRASLGHPQPFTLNHVEVGNEDFFAADTYTYRWNQFVTTLQPEFPNINFIATTNPFSPIISPTPKEYDNHVYQTPTWFAQNSFFYDSYERNGTKYFEGEYAAVSTNPNDIFGTPADGRLLFPTVQGAAGEAAFMTGLERNADIVFAASYAPLLQNVANTQWTPDLVSFDAANVYRSTSFYVQKLFSLNRGDAYVPSTLPSQNGTLHWSVVRKTSTKELIIKISNTADTEAPVTFVLPFSNVASHGTAQVLTGPANVSNTPTTPEAVVPRNSSIPTGKTFTYTAPAVSVNILTFTAH